MNRPTREVRLIHAFTALTDALTKTYDTDDLLHTLLIECTRLISVDASGILILGQNGELQLVAATGEKTALVEVMQIDADAGPCVESVGSGRPVAVDDMRDDNGRWPRFRAAALNVGFRSVYAVPMSLRGETIGAMNLFSRNIGPLSENDAALAQSLAAVATIGIMHERILRESSAVTAQLQRALNSRILIEQAKGVLAATTALEIDDAFSAMRSFARSNSISIRTVASEIIAKSIDIEALVLHAQQTAASDLVPDLDSGATGQSRSDPKDPVHPNS